MLVVLAALAYGPTARGDAADAAPATKYPRSPSLTIHVSLSDRVKPLQAKPATTAVPEITSPPTATAPKLPRLEQERVIVELIADTPDKETDEKSDLYFRLGELYAQAQHYYQATATEPNAATKAKDYLLKAVKAFRALTENDAFRNYPKMDLALFEYGSMLRRANYIKEARAAYDQLLKRYPQSKYVPEAHLAFADYYFDLQQFADAEARYKVVLRFPKSDVYAYALYKLGWIAIDTQHEQDAIAMFLEVPAATTDAALRSAAERDLVRLYAVTAKPERAYVDFARVDATVRLEVLQALGELYLDQAKTDAAVLVFGQLLQHDPSSSSACLWQYDLAHASLTAANATNADKVAAIEQLVQLARSATAASACHDDAAAMAGEMARAFHRDATKTGDAQSYAFAERLYAAYLAAFADAADVADVQALHAEALWAVADGERSARSKLERWDDTAVAFAAVIATGKLAPEAIATAATGAVLAWKNELAMSAMPARDAAHAGSTIAACEAYRGYIKDHPAADGPVALYVEATALHQIGRDAEAAALLRELVDRHPEHEVATVAASLLVKLPR
jgi:TolA-binding protein|nr:tetratricopeptide repeat protein [Kofleriaceae bacterium]